MVVCPKLSTYLANFQVYEGNTYLIQNFLCAVLVKFVGKYSKLEFNIL